VIIGATSAEGGYAVASARSRRVQTSPSIGAVGLAPWSVITSSCTRGSSVLLDPREHRRQGRAGEQA
jgi:hypothetical protein